MREYPVKITEKALRDMDGIYEYIAVNLQSPENAMRQYGWSVYETVQSGNRRR